MDWFRRRPSGGFLLPGLRLFPYICFAAPVVVSFPFYTVHSLRAPSCMNNIQNKSVRNRRPECGNVTVKSTSRFWLVLAFLVLVSIGCSFTRQPRQLHLSDKKAMEWVNSRGNPGARPGPRRPTQNAKSTTVPLRRGITTTYEFLPVLSTGGLGGRRPGGGLLCALTLAHLFFSAFVDASFISIPAIAYRLKLYEQ